MSLGLRLLDNYTRVFGDVWLVLEEQLLDSRLFHDKYHTRLDRGACDRSATALQRAVLSFSESLTFAELSLACLSGREELFVPCYVGTSFGSTSELTCVMALMKVRRVYVCSRDMIFDSHPILPQSRSTYSIVGRTLPAQLELPAQQSKRSSERGIPKC